MKMCIENKIFIDFFFDNTIIVNGYIKVKRFSI